MKLCYLQVRGSFPPGNAVYVNLDPYNLSLFLPRKSWLPVLAMIPRQMAYLGSALDVQAARVRSVKANSAAEGYLGVVMG